MYKKTSILLLKIKFYLTIEGVHQKKSINKTLKQKSFHL